MDKIHYEEEQDMLKEFKALSKLGYEIRSKEIHYLKRKGKIYGKKIRFRIEKILEVLK